MPINFDLTFTQPFIFLLDSGKFKGSRDYSKAITRAYVRTMLTGIPGGGTLPPTVLAPSLGTPPPPYPIPALPINNFAYRQRAMERVLRTYFQARQVLVQQYGIVGLIKSAAILRRKYITARDNRGKIIRQIVDVQRQILELPNLLEDIKNAVVEIIRRERDRINVLYQGLDDFKLKLTPEAYINTFGAEIQLIEELKNFRITLNINDYKILADTLAILERRLNTIPDYGGEGDEAIFKKRLMQQIQSSLRSIISLTNLFVSPDMYINYLRDLAKVDAKLQPLLNIVYRFAFIRRKLQPLLIKLRRKLEDFTARIENTIRSKIDDLKKTIQEKLKNLALKKDGQSRQSIFLKAAKWITKYKKRVLEVIKKIRKGIKEAVDIANLTRNLIQSAEAIKQDVENLFNVGFKNFYLEVVGVGKALYDSTQEPLNSFAQRKSDEALQRVFREYGFTSKRIQDAIRKTITRVVSDNNVPTRIPNVEILLKFLTSKSAEILNFSSRVTMLLTSAATLYDKLNDLFSSNKKATKESVTVDIPEDGFTLRDVLDNIKKFDAYVVKIRKKVEKYINKQQKLIEEKINKAKEYVEYQLILWAPIKSNVEDPKNKVEVFKAKKKKLKEKNDKIKKYIKMGSIVERKLLPNAEILRTNLTSLNWRYTVNGQPLNAFIDGIYEIKLFDTPKEEVQNVIRKRDKLKLDIQDYFFGFETLLDLAVNFVREANSSGFIDRVIERLKEIGIGTLKAPAEDIAGLKNDALRLIERFKDMQKYEEWNEEDYIQFFRDTTVFRILDKTYFKTLIMSMEADFLKETSRYLDKVSTNPLLVRTMPYDLKKGQDRMLVCIFATIIRFIKFLITQIITFFKKIFTKLLKPLADRLKAKFEKLIEQGNAFVLSFQKRMRNLDTVLMSRTFDLATKVFWTGFRWTTPNGVTYLCKTLGPFKPIRPRDASPDDGPTKLYRLLAASLQQQLITMNGMMIPPPATGAPPIPFVGYR